MANQECKMELLQDFGRHDGWISRFWFRIINSAAISLGNPIDEAIANIVGVAIGMTVGVTVDESIGNAIAIAIGGTSRVTVCSNPLLGGLAPERWCNGCQLALWGYKVMGNILDEQTLSLHNIL
jgi:hypothetical protein